MAHQAGGYPRFRSIKRPGVFLLPPGWDATVVYCRVTPSSKFAGIHRNIPYNSTTTRKYSILKIFEHFHDLRILSERPDVSETPKYDQGPIVIWVFSLVLSAGLVIRLPIVSPCYSIRNFFFIFSRGEKGDG